MASVFHCLLQQGLEPRFLSPQSSFGDPCIPPGLRDPGPSPPPGAFANVVLLAPAKVSPPRPHAFDNVSSKAGFGAPESSLDDNPLPVSQGNNGFSSAPLPAKPKPSFDNISQGALGFGTTCPSSQTSSKSSPGLVSTEARGDNSTKDR
ncbi:uncharacterized protein N7483_001173 [Penicillium malachiteum]|uniref:uncharacterized protein n=1 Tax=Penicillium malachiteum TaxID=1324776 RepID=UPI0025494593|nr:uncharacterized protein N7483_001173 [Penicillium malachiteum]KAJ5736048.1 hypothetical protein N7483_001173 [Penicillium malachiteum]